MNTNLSERGKIAESFLAENNLIVIRLWGNIRLDYGFVFPSSGEPYICAIINNEMLLSHGWTRTISS